MDALIQQLIYALKSYISNSKVGIEFFAYIVGAVMVVFLVCFLVLFVFLTKKNFLKLRVFNILRVMFISGCLGLFAIFSLISLYIVNGMYFSSHLQFAHLLTVVLLCILITSVLLYFSFHFSRTRFRDISRMVSTENAENLNRAKLTKSFARMKLWYLFPLIGFLFLFSIVLQPKNLISIVIDNSDTMKETSNKGESKYETARAALANTLNQVSSFNDFVVTSIDFSSNSSSYNDIVKTSDYNKLRGITQHFYNNADAMDYINTISVGGDSPITEIIFQNILYIKKNFKPENYKNQFLLIITDCRENGCINDLRQSQRYLCEETSFNEFFSPDQITLIDLEGSVSTNSYANNPDLVLMQRIIDCGIAVEDGSTLDTYNESLQGALGKLFFDKNLILWALILYLFNGIFILAIKPKKNML